MDWIIAYGIGSAIATVIMGWAIGNDWDGTSWLRVALWIVGWPILAPVFALIVIGQMLREHT